MKWIEIKAFAQLPAILLLGTVTLAAPPAVVAQTGKTPENIAEDATVLILREKTIGKGILISGSGSIIARKPEGPEGKSYTYYVLTARHVVPSNNNYRVETKSGKKYPIDFNTVREISGGECVDLAVLEFRSNNIYHPVKLEESGNLYNNTPAYISGWVIEGEQRKFSRGQLIDSEFPTGIASDNNSSCDSLAVGDFQEKEGAVAPGMSGGPILNEKGNLIGIFVATRTFGPVRGTSIETFREKGSSNVADVLKLADNPIDIPDIQPPTPPEKPPKKTEKEPGWSWDWQLLAAIATIIATAVAIIGLGIKIHLGYIRKNKDGP